MPAVKPPISAECDHCPVKGIRCAAWRASIYCDIAKDDPARVVAASTGVPTVDRQAQAKRTTKPAIAGKRTETPQEFMARQMRVPLCPHWFKRTDAGCGCSGCHAGGLKGDGKTTIRECLECQAGGGYPGLVPSR